MMNWVGFVVVVVGCLQNKKDKDLKVLRDRTNIMYCGVVKCNVFLTKDKANKHTRFVLTGPCLGKLAFWRLLPYKISPH